MHETPWVSGVAVLGVWLSLGCGSRPSAPTAAATGSLPTAAPTPTATPTPDPDVPPSDSGCGRPYPPRISLLNVKVHFKQRDFWNLDSTPLVGPDLVYCRKIGFTDSRSYCPVRPEGAPDRVACENWRVGLAEDTGQPGPTWVRLETDGTERYCGGPLGSPACRHHPENPYQLLAIEHGTYRACTASDVCGSVYVDR
jgi:hypothetical protein